MSRPASLRLVSLALTLGAALCLAAPARAQAPADSALGGYLDSLRDSTDQYFGPTAMPVDTAGLDSALAMALADPEGFSRRGRRLPVELGPWLSFSRVDGPIYGGQLAFGRRRELGRAGGRLGYAVGSDTWLGTGSWELRRRVGLADAGLQFEAGRMPASMNRELPELVRPAFRALLWGSDRHRYLRQDGAQVSLDAEHPVWRARLRWRDQWESPLDVTARWSLFDEHLSVTDNLPARPGRARELGYLAAWRTPGLPFTVEAEHATSSRRLGSDFEYRRTRLALGGDIALGRWLALVPQLSYGRLGGDAIPQASFYLGGPTTLRSLEGESLGGTGAAIARLDLLELHDLLALLRVPHPDAFPIQSGAFVASGAVWGADPYGGPARPGVDWPRREAFRHEAGVSLLYRPGLPDPSSFLLVSWAWPLGPVDHAARFSVSYTFGLDLVRPFRSSD